MPAATVSASFAATGVSASFPVAANGLWTLVITGSFVATLQVEFSDDNGVNWRALSAYTAALTATNYVAKASGLLRVNCTSWTSGNPAVSLSKLADVLLQVPSPAGVAALTVDEGGIKNPVLEGTPAGVLAYDPGQIAVNTLRVAASVVSAETVTIGSDVYEIEIVNTDSTDTCLAGSFNTLLTVTVLASDYPHLLTTLNSIIKIGTEMLRLIGTGTYLTYSRGASGTTVATHVNTTAIYIGDGVTAGRIPVGLVTTLTPTAFTAALVFDINAALGSSAVTAVLISVNEILLKANAVGAVVLATTETLGGAGNAWNATAMYGGKAAGIRKFNYQSRVPLAQDVTLGTMKFQFDFTPTLVAIYVVVTATPGVALAWDGATVISGGLVTIDNTGGTDWATTNTVFVYAQS